MKKIFVVINEQHVLLEEQKEIINKNFPDWEYLKVPASGWDLKKIKEISQTYSGDKLIFVSPVPALMRLHSNWSVFHNDRREKKELPNGKIIMTVAETGWQLV